MKILKCFRNSAVPIALIAFLSWSACAQGKKPVPGPGKIPFDYPTVKTRAKAGDWILSPPRLWIDQAFQKGPDQQTFIYYSGTMVSPGPVESKIKTMVGQEEVAPNAMIIPLRRGETAKAGDILLTWWQSGSGMKRAIVVKGGTPTEPKVMYLDLDLDNPSGIGKKIDQLKPDSFHKLKNLWDPGTAVAVKDPSKGYRHGIITNISGDKVLLIGWAGTMFTAKKSDCIPLPVAPKVKAGASVMIPSFGGFAKARVEKVDPAVGRVFVVYPFGGKDKKVAVPFGDVISSLP
ncbi:MAG: hypothetical protein HYU64_12255 [Armatimonadetes bacterium]|nr:hypothetical protein [Armatimonadota bacterium]